MMWLIDFEGYSLRNAPAVRTSLGVLHTLQVRLQAAGKKKILNFLNCLFNFYFFLKEI